MHRSILTSFSIDVPRDTRTTVVMNEKLACAEFEEYQMKG